MQSSGARRAPQSLGHKVIALLALAQGSLGVLRALDWVRIGTDLLGQGIIFLPLLGVVAFGRGFLVATIATLFVLFAIGTLLGKAWAWWFGLLAVLFNGALVFSAMIEGNAGVQALLWMVVPAILAVYLLTPAGRQPQNE